MLTWEVVYWLFFNKFSGNPRYYETLHPIVNTNTPYPSLASPAMKSNSKANLHTLSGLEVICIYPQLPLLEVFQAYCLIGATQVEICGWGGGNTPAGGPLDCEILTKMEATVSI